MDLGFLGEIHLNAQFFSALISIVIIDLVLAGDNAVVIAMAVKKLTGRQRTWGITAGAAGAVLVRVVCTFFRCQTAHHFIHQAAGRRRDPVDCR